MKTKNASNATTGRKRMGFAVILCGTLLATHSVRAFTNEFWVSAMTNANPTPAGTIGDPYDGSTQAKFDAVMNAMPSNCTIHLLGGTYLTKGQYEGFGIKSGQKILGSGMDITTIRTTNSGGVMVLATVPNVLGDSGIEISDLTCDANAQNNSTNTSYGGVWIVGTGTTIRRVKVKDLAAAPGSETWGIIASGNDNFNSEGNVIENCIVMPPVAGGVNSSCSSIAIYAGSNSYVSARISGNWVYATNTVSDQGFNIGNSRDTLLVGNHVIGAGGGCAAIYADGIYGNTNMAVINNSFINVSYGLLMGDQVNKNMVFSGNTVELSYLPSNWAVAFNPNSGCTFQNLKILGNTFKPYGSNSPYMGAVILDTGTNSRGVIVADNIVDSSFSWYFVGSSNVTMHDNLDLFGNFLSSTNQIELPNSLTRTGVSGGSYTAQYTDRYIGIQYSGGATITLPSASAMPGKELIIANETSSSTANTISASPGTVNGSSSISFSGAYTSRTIISDGSNWFAR